MPKRVYTEQNIWYITNAIKMMKSARVELRMAGADKAADYVARCIKSVEGAERHQRRMVDAQKWSSQPTK